MIKDIVVEIDGKIISKEDKVNYICVSMVVSDIVNEVYNRNHPEQN